jgi:AcrR family transcriptional regulator
VTCWSYDLKVTFYAQTNFSESTQDKRETIMNAAVEEFAEYGLENASTNRIVKNSGIAKGSFYQYFEDKQDVFMHLLDVIEQKELEYFKDVHPPDHNMDVFHYFRWMVKTGMEFGLAHPRMIQAAWRVLLGEGFLLWKESC